MIHFYSLNFKIAVLNEFLEAGLLEETFQEISKTVEKVGKDKKGRPATELHPELVRLLKNIDLSKAQLDTITDLSFEGGNDIYQLLSPEWDGEDDLFLVYDFRDVQWLSNLKNITDTTLCTITDASPLLQLTKLSYVDINFWYGITDKFSIERLKEQKVNIGSEDIAENNFDREESVVENMFIDNFNAAHELLWEEDNPEEALEIFNELLKQRPDDFDCWLEKGNALDALGRHAEAQKAWLKCLEIDPQDQVPNYNMANFMLDKGDYLKALEYINKSIEYGPEDYAEANHIKAQLLEFLGDKIYAIHFFEKAMEMYQKDLQEDEGNAETLFQIACIYNRLDKIPESLMYLKQSVSTEPENAERAREDKDFKNLLKNKDFLKIVS